MQGNLNFVKGSYDTSHAKTDIGSMFDEAIRSINDIPGLYSSPENQSSFPLMALDRNIQSKAMYANMLSRISE